MRCHLKNKCYKYLHTISVCRFLSMNADISCWYKPSGELCSLLLVSWTVSGLWVLVIRRQGGEPYLCRQSSALVGHFQWHFDFMMSFFSFSYEVTEPVAALGLPVYRFETTTALGSEVPKAPPFWVVEGAVFPPPLRSRKRVHFVRCTNYTV